VLNDVKSVPVNVSITLLFALHARWFEAIQKISESEWNKTIFHPEQQRSMTLWQLLGLYAWHGKHHVAHITSLRERNNW